MADDRQTILLTGASGYIGGRLLERLSATGRPLRCLTRQPAVLRSRVDAATEVCGGDLLDRASLDPALAGVHTAVYLVHSMGATGDFREHDRAAATNFAAAARTAGVRQIVYLGGLGREDGLSPHLASRHEVGRLLRSTGVPTVELRASIVIGPGSASFETVRAVVEQLPLILAPREIKTLAQPIAIDEVIEHLLDAIELAWPTDAIYEIGGADQVTYAELMREYARQRGLHRRVIGVPMVASRAWRVLLRMVIPRHGEVAAAMVDSLRNETIVTTTPTDAKFTPPRQGVPASIRCALAREDERFAETHWSQLLAEEPQRHWGGRAIGRRRVWSRAVRVARDPEQAFVPIQRIGGATGWYAADRFWRLRGLLDRLRGGVGLRRGRRDATDLRVGDAVDFWRVEGLERGHMLRLAAEMKIPGRLWLQFEVESTEHESLVRQTTVFDPLGYAGLIYWYLLYPIHVRVFGRMLRGIERAVCVDNYYAV
jgi:uncharacterized protein YbjT (DUF2867 family)